MKKLVKSPFTFQNVNNGSKRFTQDHGSIMGKASDDGWFNIMAFTFNHLQKYRRKNMLSLKMLSHGKLK